MRISAKVVIVCVFAASLALGDGGSGSGGPGGSGGGSGGPGSGGGSANQVSLRIPDETAPPGGVVQMKLLVTEPTPITRGGPGTTIASAFDAILGIALFNSTGDVNGAAVVNGSHVNVFYVTATGTQGKDYPIMTVALHLRSDLAVGTQTQFSLDPSSTWTFSSSVTATLAPMRPAMVTAGGTISITNVVPGGGVQPAGTVVSIQGIGFQPATLIQLEGIPASSIAVVSPNEIQVTLAQATDMTGQKIEVLNPDGSGDKYYSYTRGIPLFASNRPLLQNTMPLFSALTHSKAVYPSIGALPASQFSGVAVQNPNTVPSQVTISLFSAQNILMGSSTINVPAQYRFIAETSELTKVVPPAGSYVVVTSTLPVQSFGFIADSTQSTFVPFAAAAAQP